MLNVLRGLDPRTVSRAEIQSEVDTMKRIIANLEREINMRNKNDDFEWGFKAGISWVSYPTMDAAVVAAEKTLGPEGRHYITKVYI